MNIIFMVLLILVGLFFLLAFLSRPIFFWLVRRGGRNVKLIDPRSLVLENDGDDRFVSLDGAGNFRDIGGYQAKDGTNRANGRDITFTDGTKLFLGSSSSTVKASTSEFTVRVTVPSSSWAYSAT